MNTYPIPTEQSIKHWAETGDTEQLGKTLVTLRSLEDASAGDLKEKLTLAAQQCQLGLGFVRAQHGLTELGNKKPGQLQEEQDAHKLSGTVAQSQELSSAIHTYLESFRGETEAVFNDKATYADSEHVLSRLLADEQNRHIALLSLSRLGQVDKDWLRERAEDTKDGVTESLWEVVASGRDFMALAPQADNVQAATDMARGWAEDIDDGLKSAGNILSQAVNWLTGADKE